MENSETKTLRMAKNIVKGNGYLKSVELRRVSRTGNDGVVRNAITGKVAVCRT